MMVVTSSRLAAVRYFHEVKRYIAEQGYDDVQILAAFFRCVPDGGVEYTEQSLNVRATQSHCREPDQKGVSQQLQCAHRSRKIPDRF